MRTYQLTKGVEVRKEVNKSATIFDSTNFNYSIGFYGTFIKPQYNIGSFFNTYMSLNREKKHNGVPITEAIGHWIEKGTSSPYYSMQGKGIKKHLEKSYTRKIVEQILKENLTNKGFEFK